MADWSYQAFRNKIDEDSFIPSSAYVVDGVDVLRLVYEDFMGRCVAPTLFDEEACFHLCVEALRECSQDVVLYSADLLPRDVGAEALAMYSLHRLGGDVHTNVLDLMSDKYRSVIQRGYGDVKVAMQDSDPAVVMVCCLRILDDADFFADLEKLYGFEGGMRLTEKFEASAQYERLWDSMSMVRERFGDIALLDEMQARYDRWDFCHKLASGRDVRRSAPKVKKP